MLNGLLNSFLKMTDPTPRFTEERCLEQKYVMNGCSKCADICPHHAIGIEFNEVTLSEKACSGCGLCTQICPSGALEYNIESHLHTVQKQSPRAFIACSQTSTTYPTLHCLARLTVSSFVAAGAWNKPITLLHGDCANCAIGGADVPFQLMNIIEEARDLRKCTGRGVDVDLEQVSTELGHRGEKVNRRGLLGQLAKSSKEVAANLIPESPLPFINWDDTTEHLPSEWQWRKKALKPTPSPETLVAWRTPSIDENCNFCPVCMNICPTEAIKRQVNDSGEFVIEILPSQCVGCAACIVSCPTEAMHPQSHIAFGQLEQFVVLRQQHFDDQQRG